MMRRTTRTRSPCMAPARSLSAHLKMPPSSPPQPTSLRDLPHLSEREPTRGRLRLRRNHRSEGSRRSTLRLSLGAASTDQSDATPLGEVARRGDAARTSGLPMTILQPTAYMQNILAGSRSPSSRRESIASPIPPTPGSASSIYATWPRPPPGSLQRTAIIGANPYELVGTDCTGLSARSPKS